MPIGSSLPLPDSGGSGSSLALGEPCIHCAEGTTHRKYQVEISGIVAGGMCASGCDGYNGTFILDQCWYRALTHPDECATGGSEPLDPCTWAIGWDHGSVCTCETGMSCMEHRDWIRLTLDENITVLVHGDFSQRLKFLESRIDGESCHYDQQDVPLVASATQCNVTGATCKVSAVA